MLGIFDFAINLLIKASPKKTNSLWDAFCIYRAIKVKKTNKKLEKLIWQKLCQQKIYLYYGLVGEYL